MCRLPIIPSSGRRSLPFHALIHTANQQVQGDLSHLLKGALERQKAKENYSA